MVRGNEKMDSHKNSNTVGLEKKNVVGLILVLWARKKWELQVGGIPAQLDQESHNFCALYIHSVQTKIPWCWVALFLRELALFNTKYNYKFSHLWSTFEGHNCTLNWWSRPGWRVSAWPEIWRMKLTPEPWPCWHSWWPTPSGTASRHEWSSWLRGPWEQTAATSLGS